MKLTISKIDKVLWQGDAESVTVPSRGGILTILGHHMPLITILKEGSVIVKPKEGTPSEFPIQSGFLEVGKTETVILV